jgi:iron(III) transport system substrate-binding protein
MIQKCLFVIVTSLFSVALSIGPALPQSQLGEAKKEGSLALYTSLNIPESKPLLDEFVKRYSFIKGDLVHLSGTSLITRILGEARAGRHTADVILSRLSFITILQQAKLLGQYKSPELKGLREDFRDREAYWAAATLNTTVFVYNARMVKPENVPKSYDDLLQPFWKDKISMDTESFDWFETQLDTRGKEKGLEFMKRLKAQNPILRRGRTAQLELLAAGEFPVLLEAYSHRAEKMKEKGAPVEWISFEPVTVVPFAVVIAANAPHPNASRLFVDFVLSREGQMVFKKIGRIPARIEVEPDPPGLIRGLKLHIIGTEGSLQGTIKLYKELFDVK